MTNADARGTASRGGRRGINIPVLLDGTWSDTNTNTNVGQIHGRVPPDAAGLAQERCYLEGVGTGRLDRIRGGLFGHGLEKVIRRAYGHVARHHRSDDDRIFLIGYSRGAFTARSLAGMIAKCGLLDPDDLSAERVFERYRNRKTPGLREMQTGEQPARTAEDRLVLQRSRLVRIRFIGVFDTVGSLGIPAGLGRFLTRRKYQFHDTNLSGLVDVACHAVAVDEHRRQFEPTLWTDVPKPVPGHRTEVEQRWFVGAHGNIGGGGSFTPATENPLSLLAREWIVERAVAAGLVVDPPDAPLRGTEWNGPIHDFQKTALGRLARLWPLNEPLLRPVGKTVEETLDRSVLRRWDDADPPYRPRNPGLAAWVQSHRAAG
ncbi:DUF2235 domain-containing protein [Geodermatophilus sp. SYSU D00700]